MFFPPFKISVTIRKNIITLNIKFLSNINHINLSIYNKNLH
ncbi:hypothetical protein ClosIBUN13A_CONTIG142g02123 [Clostridium sp. IBUN13A]|uniref:Uncharacterized protein n=1 Tax=Clostridium butyricum E4 str. BoNT E BL5262 TaxID=632245 RepID=C4IIR2_CLOBU|nr:hypothetical protein CBY_3206 [Clostridium butyricum 5521]EEP54617.1 hypothetical protein CLP_2297 [Clostridium butyricum E4 str. BoNT E BL5262]EMU54435.1 hypothetical protein CBDKU1_17070 [Clostridium butyricum DKU-01]KIU07441.1 hypothetical protein SC08_Contig83orf01331 [Clostridium butyricum]KJZ97054.1 hypothetical protein ClosIBUN13A_CONTIG142g02123 [Clostridium sp. IBUN13A]